MEHNKALYFIELLRLAFNNPDRKQALKSVVVEIKLKGSLLEYEEGYNNFKIFMKLIDELITSDSRIKAEIEIEILKTKLIDMAIDSFEGSDEEKQKFLKIIQNTTELRSEYEIIHDQFDEFLPSVIPIQIVVEKDGQSFGMFHIDSKTKVLKIKSIKPGKYSVKLSTGRVLWEGKLNEKDLFWARAYPEAKLPAAAETQSEIAQNKQKPTISADLLNKELTLNVFPWFESGTMVLTFKAQ